MGRFSVVLLLLGASFANAQDILLLVDGAVRNDSLILEFNVENNGATSFSFGSAQFPIQFDDTSGLDFSNAGIIEEGFWSSSASVCYQPMAMGNLDSVLNINVFPVVGSVAACTDAGLALLPGRTEYLCTVGIPISDCSEEVDLFRAINQGDVRFNYNLDDLEGPLHNLTYDVNFPSGSTFSLSTLPSFSIVASDTSTCGTEDITVTVSGLLVTTGLSYKFHHVDISAGSVNDLTLNGNDTSFTYFGGTIENGDSVYIELSNGSCSDTSTSIVFNVGGAGVVPDFTNNLVCFGDSTQFEGQPFDPNYTYFWDFDDPSDPNDTLSGQFPKFAFTSLDTHYVNFTITDAGGCTYDTTKAVTVFNVSKPDLGPDNDYCSGDSLTLQAVQGNDYAYAWALDPATPGALTNNLDTFRVGAPGSYIVAMDSLNAFNTPVGCVRYDTIVVDEYLVAATFPNDTAACTAESVTLTASGTGVDFEWFDLGNTLLSDEDTVGFNPLGFNRQVYAEADDGTCVLRSDTIDVNIITSLGIIDTATAIVFTDSIHWAWPPVNGASSYEVYVSIDGILTVNGTSVVGDTAYGLGNLGLFGIDSVDFAYKALSNCDSVLSDSIRSVVGTCNPVASNIDSATVGFISADSVIFVWDSVQYATSYNVQVDINGGGFSANTIITDTSFTVTGLSNADSVVFRYNAVSAACNESDSSLSQAFAFNCLVNFADINTSDTICSSSFNLLLEPDTLTADMFFTGNGVNEAFDTVFWVDPEQASAGTHIITLTGCYGLETHLDTLNIAAAPCVETVDSSTVSVPFVAPAGIYTDCDGQIYFSDNSEHFLAVIDTFGVGHTLAGEPGTSGFMDGDVSLARLKNPTGMIVHPATGVIYFADFGNHAVRQFDPNTDIVTTLAGGGPLAGTGIAGVAGDSDDPTDADGLTNSQFDRPYGLAFNNTYDTIYVSDQGNREIKSLALPDNTVRIIAGNKAGGVSSIDGGRIGDGTFTLPAHINYDGYQHRLYVGDQIQSIRYVDFNADSIKTIAGLPSFNLTDGPIEGGASHGNPVDIAPDGLGNFYVLDGSGSASNGYCALRRYNINTDSLTTIYGPNPGTPFFGACGFSPMSNPTAISVFVKGFVDIANTGGNTILRYSVDDFLNSPFGFIDTLYCENEDADTLNPTTVAGTYTITPNTPGVLTSTGGYWVLHPSDTGAYELTFDHQVGPCAGIETFDLYVSPNPTADLGADTSMCSAQSGSFLLSNVDTNGVFNWYQSLNGGGSYNPLIGNSYAIAISDTGYYSMDITNTYGCLDEDTIRVINSPDFELEISRDLSAPICPEDTAILTVDKLTATTGPGLAQFVWSTGDDTQSIYATQAGVYSVLAFDSIGCFNDTSFIHQIVASPEVSISSTEKQALRIVSTLYQDSLNFISPTGITQDSKGNTFVSLESEHRIWKITNGVATPYAGVGVQAYSDNAVALLAGFNRPTGLATDRFDNLYVADAGNNVIRKIDSNGVVSTYSGIQHTFTVFADRFKDGHSDTARFFRPRDIAIDGAGNVYVADSGNHAVRMVNPIDKTVSTLGAAGNMGTLFGADGDFVTALYNGPTSLYFHPTGRLAVGELQRVRLIDLFAETVITIDEGAPANPDAFTSVVTGITSQSTASAIFSVAGDNAMFYTDGASTTLIAGQGSGYQDGDTSVAAFNDPFGIYLTDYNLLVADRGNFAVRIVQDSCFVDVCQFDSVQVSASPSGGIYSWTGPGGFSSNEQDPYLIADGMYIVEVIDGTTGCKGYDSIQVNVIPAPIAVIDTSLSAPLGLDTVYYCAGDTLTLHAGLRDTAAYDYQWFTLSGTTLTAIPGAIDTLIRVTGNTGTLVLGMQNETGCMGYDTTVLLHFNDIGATINSSIGDSICLGDTSQLMALGAGIESYMWNTGDTSSAIDSYVSGNYQVIVSDTNGCMDTAAHQLVVKNLPVVRLNVDPSITSADGAEYNEWEVGTVAGVSGVTGDADGDALTARFNTPWGLWYSNNRLWVTEDRANARIKRINLNDTTVSTVVGGGGTALFFADTLAATDAALNRSTGLVATGGGNAVFVSGDKIYTFENDTIKLLAGGGTNNAVGPGVNTHFDQPKDLAIDGFGNIYVADYNHHGIKVIDTNGFVSQYLGSTSSSPAAGNTIGLSTATELNWPWGVAVNSQGELIVVQEGGQKVSVANLDTNMVNVAGDILALGNPGFTSSTIGEFVDGPSARFTNPWNAEVLNDGRVFFTDGANNAVRVIYPNDSVVTILGNAAGGSSDGWSDSASFLNPVDLTYDQGNNVFYLADRGNHTIRKLSQNKEVIVCPGDTVELDARLSNADSYSWNLIGTGVVSTDSVYHAGDAGTYVLTVSVNGCSNSDSIVVNHLISPSLSAFVGDTTICAGDSVDLFAAGTVISDSIIWYQSNLAMRLTGSVEADTVQDVIGAGTYIVEVSNGVCSFYDTATVTISNLAASISPASDTICLFDTIMLQASASSAFGIASYAWDTTSANGDFLPVSGDQDSLILASDAAGIQTFGVMIIDSNGCVFIDSAEVLVSDTMSFAFSADTAYVCSEGGIRRVGVTVAGGLPGYVYSWTSSEPTLALVDADSSVVKLNQATALSDTAMLYLTVVDTAGCVKSDSIVLRIIDFTIESNPDHDVICAGLDDTIRTTILTDGFGSYGISWISGDSLSDTAVFNPVAFPTMTNQYVIGVLDSLTGCIANDTFDITVDTIIANPGLFQTVCVGDTADLDGSASSGAVEFTVGDPHVYRWSLASGTGDTLTGTGTSSLTRVTGGTPGDTSWYYLQVTDSIGCSALDSVGVFWNSGLTSSRYQDTFFLCKTMVDTIGVNAVFGGTPGFLYNWSVTSGTVQLGIQVNDSLIEASYLLSDMTDTSSVTVTITDTLGCLTSDTIMVIGTNLDVTAFAQFDTICPSADDTLSVAIAGGIGPFSYTWSTQNGLSDSTSAMPFANVTVTTSFLVTVLDSATGCTDTSSVTVYILPLQAVAGTVGSDTLVACLGDTVILDASGSFGGTAFSGLPYEYQWSLEAGTGDTLTGTGTLDSALVTGGISGDTSTYYLNIEDSIGCTSLDSISVFWNSGVVVNMIADTFYLCKTELDTISVNQSIGGASPYLYSWSVIGSGTVQLGINTDTLTQASYLPADITDTSEVLVTVTDDLGCSLTDTLTVIGTNLLVTANAQYDTVCPGTNNNLSVGISGGIGPFGYTWSTQTDLSDSTSATPIVNVNTTTSFLVTVIDSATGCIDTSSVTVNIKLLQAIIGVAPGPDSLIACFGDTISLTAQNSFGGTLFSGVSPYTYEWSQISGSAIVPTNDSSLLYDVYNGPTTTYSSYELVITDSLGCVSEDTTTIYWNDRIIAGLVEDTLLTCVGNLDTLDALNASGGITGYSYIWSDISGTAIRSCDTCQSVGLNVVSRDTSIVLLTVVDGSGVCEAFDTAFVIGKNLIIDAVHDVAVICPGINDTLGVVFSQDSVGPFSYTWSPSVSLSNSGIINPQAFPSSTQYYSVTVFDSVSGCLASDSVEVVVTPLNTIATEVGELFEEDSIVVCFGESDPDLTAALSNGGNPRLTGDPYNYSWTADSANIGFGNNIGLNTLVSNGGLLGSYDVYVRVSDTVGCTQQDTIHLIWNDSISLGLPSLTLSNCVGDSTILTSNVSGGSPGYMFIWSDQGLSTSLNETSVLNADSLVVSGTTRGDSEVFVLTVIDSLGCQNRDSIVVEVNQLFVALTADYDTVCSGTDVILRVGDTLGGIGPYGYGWHGLPFTVNDTDVVNVTVSGTFGVTVLDSITGCTDMDTVPVIVEDVSVTIGNEFGDTILCAEDSILILNANNSTGGTTPYNYSWSINNTTIPFDSVRLTFTQGMNGLNTGTEYAVIVTDDLGCVGTDSTTIYRDYPINLTVISGDTMCLGQMNIIGTNTASGGNGNGLEFVWTSDKLGFFADSSVLDPIFMGLDSSGDYVLQLVASDVDAPQCKDSATVGVNIRDIPQFEIVSDTVVCEGDTIYLSVDETGATFDASYSYVWSETSMGNLVNASDSLGVDTAGVYVVTVSDRFGCSNMDTSNVRQDQFPMVSIVPLDSQYCSNSSIGLEANLSPVGGDLLWSSDGLGGILNNTDSITTYFLGEASGEIGFTATYSNGCGTVSVSDSTTIVTSPTATVTVSDTLVPIGGNVTYSVVTTGSNLSFDWEFDLDNTPITQFENVVGPHTVTYVEAGTFRYELLVIDTVNGCEASIVTGDIAVDPTQLIYVPNVFSPGATNVENQTLKVYGTSVSSDGFEFAIYNRWGEEVYRTTDRDEAMINGWDGADMQTQNTLEVGTFTYILSAKFGDGTNISMNGNITMLK